MLRHAGMAVAILWTMTAETSAADESVPRTVEIPAMRTSIYIGSVTLTVSPLVRTATTLDFSADYRAQVIPWLFWSETGTITLRPQQSDLERLLDGETIEVSGSATNHKGKGRSVSARIQPTDATDGAIKVRIDAGGTKLIFNGQYHFAD